MKNESLGRPDKYEYNDYSAQNIINHISRLASGRAWTHEKMQDVSKKANGLLDKNDSTDDSLDVFAAVGASEIHVEQNDGNLLPHAHADSETVIWGRINEFSVKRICESSNDTILALCVRLEALDKPIGEDILWLPLARVGKYGIEIEMVGAPDVTSVQESDAPESEMLAEVSAELWGYRTLVADTILADDSKTTSQETAESIEQMYARGVIPNLDLFSTAANMVISEGLKEGDVFAVDLSGQVEYMTPDGMWSERDVDDEQLSLVAMEFFNDTAAPMKVYCYAYMTTAEGRVVRSTMGDNNFLIEHRVSAYPEDTE